MKILDYFPDKNLQDKKIVKKFLGFIFVTNSDRRYAKKNFSQNKDFYIGIPQATSVYSAKQLMEMDLVGIYRLNSYYQNIVEFSIL